MSMLYNHNLMELHDWVKADDPNIHRLLITHTDLDGYGCEVMTMGMIRCNHHDIASHLTVYHINPGTDCVSVAGYVNNKCNNYIKGEDTLFILITDLGSINLDFYANMIKDGHKIRLIIVDHHQTTFKESKDPDNVVDTVTITFFHETSISSTKQLFNLWMDRRSNLNLPINDSETVRYQAFAERVSKYDTGKWSSNWFKNTFGEVMTAAPEVIEQLKFIAYRDNSQMEAYILDILKDIEDGPGWQRTNDNDSVYGRWLDCMAEYTHFCHNMVEMNPERNKTPLFTYNGGVHAVITVPSVYGVTVDNKDNDYKFFSLISRKILEERDDIDILVLINNVRHTVELRTDKHHINVAEIAKLNGGGGHPKAAGFPIPKQKE